MTPRVLLASCAALATSACGSVERLGSADFCIAASTDEAESADTLAREGTFRGLTRVAEDARSAPPDTFASCAQGHAIEGEFEDEDGVRVWLSLDAVHGGYDLLPGALLSLVDDATLTFETSDGWSFQRVLDLVVDDRVIVALRANASVDAQVGALDVESGGAASLPGAGPCGSETATRLRFTDDDDAPTAANGERVELTLAGREALAWNLYTVEHGSTHCEDGPGEGIATTWVAFDNTL